MKLYTVCAILLLVGNALCASADKPTWTSARPTQPAPKTSASSSSITAGAQRVPEKPTWVSAKPTKTPSATIGQHRVPEATPAPATTKKSTSQVAIKAAGKAAPEIIKGLPGVIQSIHTAATGGTQSTSTPTPSTDTSTQTVQPKKIEPTHYYELGHDDEEEETEEQ